MEPKVEKLPTPPSVAFWWNTSEDSKQHTLLAFVDGWEIEVPYGVHWIEGEALTDAIETERLPAGTAPGWHIQDDCGDVLDEPLTPDADRPLDVLLWREIVAKLEEVRR